MAAPCRMKPLKRTEHTRGASGNTMPIVRNGTYTTILPEGHQVYYPSGRVKKPTTVRYAYTGKIRPPTVLLATIGLPFQIFRKTASTGLVNGWIPGKRLNSRCGRYSVLKEKPKQPISADLAINFDRSSGVLFGYYVPKVIARLGLITIT